MVKTAQSLLLGVTWVAAALGLWFFLCDGSFTQPSGDHHGPFLGPRRLTLTSEVEPSTCCRFAHRFEGVNWSDATVRSDFLANVLSVERRFFAAHSIAFDEESGMTYDGTSLNLSTGDVESDGLRLFSAPSKESLHISLLALALQNPKDVSPEFRKLQPLIYSEKEALDILEKKVTSMEDFDRRFPAFGGFLPWFCTRGWSNGKCKGLKDPFTHIAAKIESEKIGLPALDNGQMAFAVAALVQVLGLRSAESSQFQKLAERWEQRLQRMKDTAVNLFYDGPGTGTVRAIATLEDLTVDAADSSDNAYNKENYVLWDPFEGEMIVVFLDLYGDWSNYTDSKAEKDKIWDIKKQHVQSTSFNTSKNETLVIQKGFWFSSHEQWKILQLPYLDIPLAHRLFVNGEVARLSFSKEKQLNGLLASVNAPTGFHCDSANGKYCSALGIQSLAEQPILTDRVLTPYGAFPAILIEPAAGLAWYQRMLRMPRAQTVLGSIESFTQNGSEVAPIVTWDAKVTTVLAMLGGTGDLARDYMKRSSAMDGFVQRVEKMYEDVFGPKSVSGTSKVMSLPMPPDQALPRGPAGMESNAKCGCE